MKLSLNITSIYGYSAGFLWSICCIIFFVGFDQKQSFELFWILILYLYANFKLWSVIFQKKIAPLSLFFWLYISCFTLLPAYAQVSRQEFFWYAYQFYVGDTLIFALLILTTSFITFELGGWIAKKYLRFSDLSCKSPMRELIIYPTSRLYAASIFILTLVSIFIYFKGLNFFVYKRGDFSGMDSQVDMGIFLVLPRALAFSVLIVWIAVIKQHFINIKIPTLSFLIMFIVIIIVNSVVNYPYALARFWIFGFIIAIVLVAIPPRNNALRIFFTLSFFVMQFTIFPLYSEITRGSGGINLSVEILKSYLLAGDFADFQMLADAVLYIQDKGFLLGKNLLSVVLFMLPRELWDKAEPLGLAVANYHGAMFNNLSSPIFAELYVDFGFLSLVLGMAFIGFGIQFLDAAYDRSIRSGFYGKIVVLVSLLAGYLPILLRGSLLAVIAGIATLLIISALLIQISRVRTIANEQSRLGGGFKRRL